jgi:cellulose synthase/poly-beta-1,6-N-acetylglucosamine synthase-like glycosyltransferase
MWISFLFWISLGVIFFTYVGYPFLLFLFSLFEIKKGYQTLQQKIPVSVIIAAYNEEKLIQEKIKNTLEQNYPAELLQIIVVADGSTDLTVTKASEYKEVLVLFDEKRKGKAAALNRAIDYAVNDVIILTDANSFLQPGALFELVKPFAYSEVGAVAGEKKVINEQHHEHSSEGLYWQYESWIKQQETKFFSVIGAAGELFAIRKNLYSYIPEQIITDDFFLSVSVNLQHKKVAYAKKAVSVEFESVTIRDEWRRKVRIAAGGIQSLFYISEALNFFRHPKLAFQFFCHRVSRWLFCSPAIIVLFFENLYLTDASDFLFYKLFFWMQVMFYVFASAGWLLALQKKYVKLVGIPFYIVFMHAAMLTGMIRFLARKQSVLWEKAQR